MRFHSFFAAICLLALLFFPTRMGAETLKDIAVGNLIYNLDTDSREATIVNRAASFSTSSPWIIPSSITYSGTNYTVVAIQWRANGDHRFGGSTPLPSVTLPNTLRVIGDYAFSNCGSLTSIEIPSSVTTIGQRAFNNCRSVSSLTIPESVEYIGSMACAHMSSLKTFRLFSTCTIPSDLFKNDSESANNVTTFELSGNIETIPKDFMKGATNLQNVILGDNVKVIKNSAFEGCTNLTSVTLPANLTNIELYAFYECSKLAGKLNFPASCVEIGEAAFKGCFALEEVEFNGIPKIGQNAFDADHSIKKVTINEGTEQINISAFAGCSGITELKLPSSLKVLQSNAFEYCSNITTLTLPAGLQTLGSYAFQGCEKLEEVTVPTNCTTLGAGAFRGCTNLKHAEILSVYAMLGSGMFQNCTGLESVKIAGGVYQIATSSFQGCTSLNKVEITAPVTTFASNAFLNATSLENITLPSSTTKLQSGAFQNTAIKAYTIPASVTTVDRMALDSDPTSVRCYATTPPTAKYDIVSNYSDCYLYVPAESEAAYKAHAIWGKFKFATPIPQATSVVIPTQLTLRLGSTTNLNPQLLPAESYLKISYASTDNSIVAVAADGTLTAKGAGTATINLKNAEGTVLASCDVTVVTAKYEFTTTDNLGQTRHMEVSDGSVESLKPFKFYDLIEGRLQRNPQADVVYPIGRQKHTVRVTVNPGQTLSLNVNLSDGTTKSYSLLDSENSAIETETIEYFDYNIDHTLNAHWFQEETEFFTFDNPTGSNPLKWNGDKKANFDVTFYTYIYTAEDVAAGADPNIPCFLHFTATQNPAFLEYEAMNFKLLVWDEATFKAKNSNTTNSNSISHDSANAAYDFLASEWHAMTDEEINQFHTDFLKFKGDGGEAYYNTPDGKFVYTYTLPSLPKGTYLTIDGLANDGHHWGIPSSLKGQQLASDGASFFEFWDGTSGYPIIYNYGIDGKDVTIEFYTLTFPQNKTGQYITGPTQPHDVTLHVENAIPGEQYTVPTYKLLVWDKDNYESTNGYSYTNKAYTNSNNGSHEDANSHHDFTVSEWQPMTAEEIAQFKADYYSFKGNTYANQYYNEPDGKFVHTFTYEGLTNGTHLTIDGRLNTTDQKHWGVPNNLADTKYATHGSSYIEMWDGDSGHPIIYNDQDGKDVTVQFSTLTFPKTLANGATGEPNQPRYVSLYAVDPTTTGIVEVSVITSDGTDHRFDGAAIYTLSGIYLGTDPSQLPSGLYIQTIPGATRKLAIK